ncbi:MAG: DUF1289 domain-containing protein [Oceanospirillaceae bacterium]|nr:DUF1289 domain-containing protein [Oceanospirillaceae bacterium]MCP5335830.1 DUF1289 domain-containing protein [Oceanospirillaceae bacterium]MCP5349648.1 DUF1289 domain-containing protein [Oceanospirillaceae bacterium]
MSDKPVISPCVGICALDENDICIGCYRTGREISDWGMMANDQRREVLQKVAERERAAANFIAL